MATRRRNLPHLASRLFSTPLLVDDRKLDVVVPWFLAQMQGHEPAAPDPDDARPVETEHYSITSGIAVIRAIGSFVRRPTWLQAYSGLTSYPDMQCALRCALEDDRVRAVLWQVDSMGGEAPGCFELSDEIFAARAVKPQWGSADVDALSAGYAILAATERCFAAPAGAIGSIGAVSVHLETSRADDAAGLTYTVFRAGARKADLNRFEPLTATASDKLQITLDKLRARFARGVAQYRSGVTARAALDTEGQWYDPDDALRLKLIDGIATFEDVFEQLLAAYPPPVRLGPPPPQPPAPMEDEDEDEEGDPELPEGEVEMEPTAVTPPAAAAQPSAVPPATETTDNVIALTAARGEGRAAALEEVRQIGELCTIAGKPELAAQFLAEGKSLADVRKALIDLRASASQAQADTLDNRQPERPARDRTTALESWKRPFEAVHAGRR